MHIIAYQRRFAARSTPQNRENKFRSSSRLMFYSEHGASTFAAPSRPALLPHRASPSNKIKFIKIVLVLTSVYSEYILSITKTTEAPQMAQKNRISETEWKQLLPQMASFAHITTDIGYSVLVKGEKSSDVATRVGRSKQNISSTVKRIWDLYQNTTLKAENGEPLKLVQVWIPASLAETVLKEAAKYSINNITTSEMEKK